MALFQALIMIMLLLWINYKFNPSISDLIIIWLCIKIRDFIMIWNEKIKE